MAKSYNNKNSKKKHKHSKHNKATPSISSKTCNYTDNAPGTPTDLSLDSPDSTTAHTPQKLQQQWKVEFRATYLAFVHWRKITKDQIDAYILQQKMKECGNWKESLDLIETGLWWAPMLDHQHKDAMLVVLKHLENNVTNLDSQIIVQEHQLQNIKLELNKINAINHAQAILLERKSIKIREMYTMFAHM